MRIEIPVLVEPDVHPEGGGSIYRVRPLLFDGPDRSDRILATALAKLNAALEKDLNELGRSGEHERLAARLTVRKSNSSGSTCGSISATSCSGANSRWSHSTSSIGSWPSRRVWMTCGSKSSRVPTLPAGRPAS